MHRRRVINSGSDAAAFLSIPLALASSYRRKDPQVLAEIGFGYTASHVLIHGLRKAGWTYKGFEVPYPVLPVRTELEKNRDVRPRSSYQ